MSSEVEAYITSQQQRKGKALRGVRRPSKAHSTLNPKFPMSDPSGTLHRYSFSKIKRYQELKEGAEKAAVVKLPALRWTAKHDGNMHLENMVTEQLEDEIDDLSYGLFSREGQRSDFPTSRQTSNRSRFLYNLGNEERSKRESLSPRQNSNLLMMSP